MRTVNSLGVVTDGFMNMPLYALAYVGHPGNVADLALKLVHERARRPTGCLHAVPVALC